MCLPLPLPARQCSFSCSRALLFCSFCNGARFAHYMQRVTRRCMPEEWLSKEDAATLASREFDFFARRGVPRLGEDGIAVHYKNV